MAVGITDEVDDGHIGGDLLLLSDEEDSKSIFAKSFLDGGKAEVIHGSASVCLQADTEDIEVFGFGSVDEGNPGRLSIHLGDARPVDNATRLAVDSTMTLLVAEFAGAIERTLDTLIGTVRLVVTDLAAVEALASEAASTALRLLRAVAGEVTGLLAAIKFVSTMVVARLCDQIVFCLHSTAVVASITSTTAGVTTSPRVSSTGVGTRITSRGRIP